MSIAKMSFFNILITTLIFIVVIGLFLTIISNNSYESRISELEANYLKKNKELIQHEVERAVKHIDILNSTLHKDLRETLEEKVNYIHTFLQHIYQSDTANQDIIGQYRDELKQFRWDHDTGYFYIFDKDKMLYHGSNSDYEGMKLTEIAGNNSELANFFQSTFEYDEYYGEYPWYKPDAAEDQLYRKYVYVKKIQDSNIFIAAGIYKSELRDYVINIVSEELEQDRFGDNKYGYFWIKDLDYTMLMHPVSEELEQMDLREFQTLDKRYLFIEMNDFFKNNSSGFFNYDWYRPDTMEPDGKITFAKIYDELEIVIGSGFYLGELNESLIKEKDSVRKELQDNLQKILTTLGLLTIIMLLIAFYISKRIGKVEIKQMENLLMLEQYKAVLDKSAVVSKTDLEGRITYVNSKFAEISKYAEDELVGELHNIVRHPQTPKQQFKELWDAIQIGETWEGLIKNKDKHGNSYYNRAVIVPLKDAKGNIQEYISASTDVTELLENKDKIANIFSTDALTGLGNRLKLINLLAENKKGTLALINIDHFKEINDTYGQDCGDKTIKLLADRLFNFLTEDTNYSVFRIQADEFALYSELATKEEMADIIQSFIISAGKELYIVDEKSFRLTYSSGIAEGDENILAYADIALSEAKNKKNKFCIYEPSLLYLEKYKTNIIWVDKLHAAIKEDRVTPFFQPIYNLETQEIEKYECLMRIIEGNKVVSPGEFLSIAKRTKLYPELSYKMISKSIAYFSNFDFEFSINLGAEDLMNSDLMLYLCEYAVKENIASRMVLEIVETEEIEEYDEITNTIKVFKENGIKIAIDDFGTGYSNYDYLISLQADYIKIDGSLIKHLLDDDRTREVVTSIVNFAKKSNMKTIAEYVSSEELSNMVKKLGIDYAQGYYHGKPVANIE